MPTPAEFLDLDGQEVKITNPEKVFFPDAGLTKMDLVRYYLEVAPAALVGCKERPTSLYRWPHGVAAPEDAFFQKRLNGKHPEWIKTAVVKFPSGRQADMLTIVDEAHLAWAVNLGVIDINPWPVRTADLDHPDELRVDLDPTPEFSFDHAKTVAPVVREVLQEHGLTGWPKTSGKRGMHIYVRIEPQWEFTEVRRAALALAREVERRMPRLATTAWWKEERNGVFVDYNQNARDRTIASAYSVRPVADGRVSCPITWDEVADVEPSDLTMKTVPQRLADAGDAGAGIDESVGVLDQLLELAWRDEKEGLGDAPWPPHFPKAKGEPRRVQPSKAKKT
jgi:bifunctional non-homologous end joining protein LigD